MKKIIIELSDQQYDELKQQMENGFIANLSEETSGDCIIKLFINPIETSLEIEMNTSVDLGEVKWRIE